MNFNGGVIIIGSLLWDDNKGRKAWRQDYLRPKDTKIPVPLKIRYGRESESRNCTYTMIFSNHPTTELGQGYVWGFKENSKIEGMLEKQAIALAKVEGICTDKRPFLGKDWGAVGLLVNETKKSADLIKSIWIRLFQKYKCDQPRCRFDHSQYGITDEPRVIDEDGFLHIDWTPEMNDFDFLMATPTVPIPHRLLIAEEIATRMLDRKYKEYFYKNNSNNITTFQDEKILVSLRR